MVFMELFTKPGNDALMIVTVRRIDAKLTIHVMIAAVAANVSIVSSHFIYPPSKSIWLTDPDIDALSNPSIRAAE